MADKEVTVVATQATDASLILQSIGNTTEITELIRDNIGNDGLDAFSLARVRVPAGGGIAWTIPTFEGPEVQKTIRGVIIHWKTWRAMWEGSYGEGGSTNAPPDCASKDGATGTGNPGGDCSSCPLNQFGSADNGRGKECKEVRAVFLLTEGALLPNLIAMPPMSIKPLKDYFLQLASNRIPYWTVVTEFSLEQTRNTDGIVYSKAIPKFINKLTTEEQAAVFAYRAQMTPVIEGEFIERGDVEA